MDIQPHLPEIHTGFVRRRCRNPHCGAKLKRETDNPRNAFCCYGCFEQHYRKLCIVCERPLRHKHARKAGRPTQFCRQKCKSEFHRNPGRFLAGWGAPATTLQGPVRNGVRSAHSTGLKTGAKRDRPWRVVAGPGANLDPVNLAIPLDAETAARTGRSNTRHWAEAALIGPRNMPINLKHARDLEREIERRRAASEADHG
jgi:hypothetical protein